MKSVSDKLTATKNPWKSVENHTSNPWKSVLNFTATAEIINLWKSVENHTSHPWKSVLNFTAKKSAKSVKSVSDKPTAAKNKSVEIRRKSHIQSVEIRVRPPTPQPMKIHLHIRKNFRNFALGKHLVTI